VTVANNNTNTTHKIIQDHDSIIITADAVEQINNLAKLKRPDAPDQMYLRVYVDAGGCSGFQYKFEIENADDTDADGDTSIDPEEDVVILCQDPETKVKVTVVVDEGSLELLKGSTISYVKEMIRSCFAVVSNPQSESACGCGSSFAVKKFESNPALD
jgi:iron-sulfur cluster assembly accessory protein